jgi:hypothetical protein
VSVVATLVGVAGLTAAGWGVEMVGLPQPTTAERLAALAEGWLRNYPLTIDSFHGRHVKASGICLRTSARSFARSRLAIANGPPLAVSTGHVRPLRTAPRSRLPGLLASRIGCTATLLQPVMSTAEAGAPVDADHAFVGREPVLALHLPPYKGERFVLYVSPKTVRPLMAESTLGGVALSATLHLERVDPRGLARLRPELGLRREQLR